MRRWWKPGGSGCRRAASSRRKRRNAGSRANSEFGLRPRIERRLEYRPPRRRELMQRRQFNKALAAAAAAAAVSPFNMARAQAQKLRVGVILPRSGYLGFIGQSCQKGADLAPGLIKELLGVDIEL